MAPANATGAAGAEVGRTQEPSFPLKTFQDAAQHLRRPFTAEAVRFKVQAAWPKENPTNGLVVCYIDARLVVERLNLIIPDRWSDSYRSIGGGLMWCDLTVDGITRSDVGEGHGKALVSDALKRAAVKFGVGVSLYATPKMFIGTDGDQARQKPNGKGGKTLELRPRGEMHIRNLYAQWLAHGGTNAFGEALDHGDVMDAAGDPEEAAPVVDEPATPDGTSQTEGTPPESDIKQQLLGDLVAAKKAAALPDTAEARAWTVEQFRAVGVKFGADEHITAETLQSLDPEQTEKLIDVFQELADRKVAA